MSKITIDASVDPELVYDTVTRSIPANGSNGDVDDYIYTPPEGHKILSWGVRGGWPEVHIRNATINDNNAFWGVFRSLSYADQDVSLTWTFVLLKVG
jgi:hypothetical protein